MRSLFARWKALALRHPMLAAALGASLLATLYWGSIASDRYVSEAHVIIQRTEITGGEKADLGSLLSNGDAGSRADQLLLRDHLLSVDMLMRLDSKLDLRSHYSDIGRDPLSRMWMRNAALERFHRHYLSRVSVEYDDHAGVLVIKAQGYDPKMAHAIAAMMVEEGERFMNEMGHRLALDQVRFLEKQVAEVGARMAKARLTLLDYQDRKGMVSPQATTENYVAIVSRLEAQLADLEARRASLLGTYAPKSQDIVNLDLQADALAAQISKEKARLAAPNDKTLNRSVDQFQRLQMDVDLSLEVYKTALIALERGRIEATRTLKKVSVLQSPFLPAIALEPRRAYNILVFFLVALLVAGIAHLIAAVVRDHQD